MATYAKILKDNAGNQILPYTRSKLVYMNDGSTVEDAINNIQNQGGYTLPAATRYTLGGVKIGNNINISNGAISIGNSEVTNALGYTPLAKNVLFDSYSMSERGARKTIGRLGSGYNLDDYLSNFTFNIYSVDNTLFNFYILAYVKSDIIQNSSSLEFVYFRNSPYTGVANTSGDTWYHPMYYAISGSADFKFLGTALITSYDKGKQFNIKLNKFTISIGAGITIMLNIPMRIM